MILHKYANIVLVQYGTMNIKNSKVSVGPMGSGGGGVHTTLRPHHQWISPCARFKGRLLQRAE